MHEKKIVYAYKICYHNCVKHCEGDPISQKYGEMGTQLSLFGFYLRARVPNATKYFGRLGGLGVPNAKNCVGCSLER